MQYTSRCYLLQWFHQEIRCCSDVLWQNWKSVKNLFFIFNAVDSRHNGHIQNCRQDTIVCCYSTRTIILCTKHTMIYELDKQTKNIDFWVETRKIERRTPSKSSKMCSYCHVFIFSNVRRNWLIRWILKIPVYTKYCILSDFKNPKFLRMLKVC